MGVGWMGGSMGQRFMICRDTPTHGVGGWLDGWGQVK